MLGEELARGYQPLGIPLCITWVKTRENLTSLPNSSALELVISPPFVPVHLNFG